MHLSSIVFSRCRFATSFAKDPRQRCVSRPILVKKCWCILSVWELFQHWPHPWRSCWEVLKVPCIFLRFHYWELTLRGNLFGFIDKTLATRSLAAITSQTCFSSIIHFSRQSNDLMASVHPEIVGLPRTDVFLELYLSNQLWIENLKFLVWKHIKKTTWLPLFSPAVMQIGATLISHRRKNLDFEIRTIHVGLICRSNFNTPKRISRKSDYVDPSGLTPEKLLNTPGELT